MRLFSKKSAAPDETLEALRGEYQNYRRRTAAQLERAEADGIWVLADFDENSSLRAALLAGDDYESPEGFSESDCKLVKEPDGWTRLEFARLLSELKGKNFCMRFVIKNVKLYAVKGGFRCVSGRY